MKKCFKLLLVAILGIFFIPMVYAQEIPKEGVTYFLMYPNGEEDVVETYSAAMGVKEKLIYEGYTNDNGQFVLSGLEKTGKLRIVQEVPEGYTTNTRELKVDLANNVTTANFVDYRGLSNPSTGNTLFVFFSVFVVVAASVVVSRKNKKVLMIIPIGICAFALYNVHAWTDSFVVSVVDGKGKALSNVRIMVYATPVIDAQPAVKFSSNGGYFFDGSTEMYYRLPSASCTYDDFEDSLSENDYYKLYDNIEYAYRAGYQRAYPNVPATLTNGTVLSLNWTPNDSVVLYHIIGNGGSYNFYGEELDSVSIYDNSHLDIDEYIYSFKNADGYFVGTDDNKSCYNYNQYGLVKNYNMDKANGAREQSIYLCWNARPDGVYVNNTLFGGTDESCFRESYMYNYSSSSISLYSNDYYYLGLDYEDNFMNLFYEKMSMSKRVSDSYVQESASSSTITSVEVVKNGQVVVSISSSELARNGGRYIITNTSKANTFYHYFDELRYNGCFHTESAQ